MFGRRSKYFLTLLTKVVIMMLLIMLLYEEANKKTVHIPVLDNFGKKAESTASETEPTRLGNMIDFNIKL